MATVRAHPERDAGHFKLLLDTNAFIAVEPTSTARSPGLASGAELLRLASAGGHTLFLHPATKRDFERDQDAERKAMSLALMGKYQILLPVLVPSDLVERLGEADQPADPLSNNGVDLEMIAALEVGAVDYLVTGDARLRSRAGRAGLGEFVLRLADAVELLRNVAPRDVRPPPAVEAVVAYQLNALDPIFASLADDYPGFEDWFRRARHEHRPAWAIVSDDGSYAGVVIVKDEPDTGYGLPGRVLKVSTFKVSDAARGRKYGELLLKTIFAFAHERDYDTIYVTAFEKQELLIDLVRAFGFERLDQRSGLGELVLVKYRRPVDVGRGSSLDLHVRHGPPYVDPRSEVFVVPIEPRWHEVLFPERVQTLPISTGEHPYGNALRKAYVSGTHSRLVGPGSTLLFYRSRGTGKPRKYQSSDDQAVTVVGVVEQVLVDTSPDSIARFVGRRTVYTVAQIEQMAAEHGELHAMLFRQDRMLEPPWGLDLLQAVGVVTAWPQSITKIRERGRQWVHQQLDESH